MIVYKITDNTNSKCYVGKTTRNVGLRISEHKSKGSTIGEVIRMKGASNFTISILENCDSKEEMDLAEERWILHLNSVIPNGYNKAVGEKRFGEFNGFYGKNHSLETINKNLLNQPFRRVVQVIETGEKFDSMRGCAKSLGITRNLIYRHCENKVKYPKFKYAD